MAIYHAYTQTVADGTATSVVRPSDWNSGHVQGFFLAGNTSNASTVTGTDVYFSGGNGVTLSGSNNSIGISVATGFNVSAGTTSNNITQLVFPDSNGITWGLNSNSLTANIPMLISAANGTGSMSTLSFQNGGGVSWSTNANGIQASVAGAGATLSYWEPAVAGATTSNTSTGGLFFQPFVAPNNIAMVRAQFMQSLSQLSSTMSFSGSVSGGSATSGTGSVGVSKTLALYSRVSTGTNASSSRIVTFASGSMSQSFGMSASVSWSTNASSATVSFTTSGAIGYIQNIGSNGAVTSGSFGTSGSNSFSSTSTNANSFSSSFAVQFLSSVGSGIRQIQVPLTTTLTAGEYWIAAGGGATSGSTNMSLQNVLSASVGYLMYSSATSPFVEYGSTASSTGTQAMQFWGYFGGGGTGSSASTNGFSDNFTNASNQRLWFNMMAASK